MISKIVYGDTDNNPSLLMRCKSTGMILLVNVCVPQNSITNTFAGTIIYLGYYQSVALGHYSELWLLSEFEPLESITLKFE